MDRKIGLVAGVCIVVTLFLLAFSIGQLDYMLFLIGMSTFFIVMEISIQSDPSADSKEFPLWRKALDIGLATVVIGTCFLAVIFIFSPNESPWHKLLSGGLSSIPVLSIPVIGLVSMILLPFMLINSMRISVDSTACESSN